MDEKEAEARPLMGTIFLVMKFGTVMTAEKTQVIVGYLMVRNDFNCMYVVKLDLYLCTHLKINTFSST